MLDLPSKCLRFIFSLILLVCVVFCCYAQTNDKLMTFRSTCYCHGGKECKVKSKGITAIGSKVRRGTLAADPSVLKMRTVVEIIEPKTYAGIYKVEDTGKLIKKNRLDLWAPTQKECVQFGVKRVVLRIVK